VVFERSGFGSYANCGLPYYIGGAIGEARALTLQTPESFSARFRVAVKVRHEVTALHPDRKTVSVKSLETGEEWEESYDKLILSPGARPTRPRLPGVELEKLFTLRTVEDTLRIKAHINAHHPSSAVLAGGGFIKLALGQTVEGFAEKDGGVDVIRKEGPPLHAGIVVLAIGVTPDTGLAKEAGLELGLKDSIIVNDRMETSVPDIYAVGDAVQVKHYVTGQDAVISLAGPANKQGRIAADNICGGDSRYLGSQGSSVIKVFDLTAACTGVNESGARRAGLEVDAVILSPMSHAGYYPGGRLMTMKVVFEKGTYRLLGAQIVGSEGVDKRIDVLAAAIHGGMKATGLKELDLAYAPPYSSAKDPVNMAGFMIDNIARGILRQWFLEDLDRLPRDGSVTLLDVRTAGEYGGGHIDGFRNIPVDELRERLDEVEPGKPVYVICQSGLRSYIACRILAGYGYEAYNFAGGFRFYSAAARDRRMAELATACGMDR